MNEDMTERCAKLEAENAKLKKKLARFEKGEADDEGDGDGKDKKAIEKNAKTVEAMAKLTEENGKLRDEMSKMQLQLSRSDAESYVTKMESAGLDLGDDRDVFVEEFAKLEPESRSKRFEFYSKRLSRKSVVQPNGATIVPGAGAAPVSNAKLTELPPEVRARFIREAQAESNNDGSKYVELFSKKREQFLASASR